MHVARQPRPRSVTIVSWWIICTAIVGVYSSATMESDPLAVRMAMGSTVPLAAQQLFGIVNGLVLALCGHALLRGRHWARLAFVAWSFVGFLAGIAIVGLLMALIFSGLSVGITMFFLCRPAANTWFTAAR